MSETKPVVAIIGGTGTLGSGLARRLAAAGYTIVIGSRDAGKADAAAKTLSESRHPAPRAPPTPTPQRPASVVLLTVPFANHVAILDEIKPHVAGKIVVDTTVPLVPPKRRARAAAARDLRRGRRPRQRLGERRAWSPPSTTSPRTSCSRDMEIDCDVLVFGDDRRTAQW